MTTKNTNLKRKVKKEEESFREKPIDMIISIIFIMTAILIITMKACNNTTAGYDHWIGMPQIWR